MDIKFDFHDISIKPAITTPIRSRNEIQPLYNKQLESGNWLNISPIIVSPMDTVIDEKNYSTFIKSGMMCCIPRGCELQNITDLEKEYVFFSYGLEEFEKLINTEFAFPKNILIDIANGHISYLIDLLKKFKSIYKSHQVMVGNIANPESYRVLSEAGADYIRCGIGGGTGCLTSEMTAIHYPMASLINETYLIKQDMISKNQKVAKIVGDGGFREYSDIIKGLALGADFIMCGSALNKCVESAGETYWTNWAFTINLTNFKVPQKFINFLWKKNAKLEKKFRGMSTKEVQRKWGKVNLRASEGVIRFRKVEYDLSGWYRNLEDYLKSCMSYTGFRQLSDFIGKPEFIKITNSAYLRYNK